MKQSESKRNYRLIFSLQQASIPNRSRFALFRFEANKSVKQKERTLFGTPLISPNVKLRKNPNTRADGAQLIHSSKTIGAFLVRIGGFSPPTLTD
jgi:hypothetical protein